MLTDPNDILTSKLDPSEPDFPARSMRWTDQMQAEMKELVAGSRATIDESRALLAAVNRLLAQR